jgi:hypothetical protein
MFKRTVVVVLIVSILGAAAAFGQTLSSTEQDYLVRIRTQAADIFSLSYYGTSSWRTSPYHNGPSYYGTSSWRISPYYSGPFSRRNSTVQNSPVVRDSGSIIDTTSQLLDGSMSLTDTSASGRDPVTQIRDLASEIVGVAQSTQPLHRKAAIIQHANNIVALATQLLAEIAAPSPIATPSPSPIPAPALSPSPTPALSPSQAPAPSPNPVTAPSSGPSGGTFYVSRNGNNTDGSSWTNAWSELANIDWSVVQPGDTILIDGGSVTCPSPYDFTTSRPGVSCGMEYDTTLTVGASGTPNAPITIRLASGADHGGTAVFFGGRATPLPYCHQQTYSARSVRQYGILVGPQHDVVIDGGHRSGIMVYGAVQGVRVSSASATRLTFERMEVFDNGSIVSNVSGGGYNSDEEGFSLAGGTDMTLRGDIIHDNGQDGVQDETRPNGSLDGLLFDTDWIYNRRENPLYPGYGFNEPQSTGCTHADSIQLYSGGPDQSGLTVTHSILGPLVNQGLYPSDGGTGATWSNVTVSDSLLLAVSHNVISDNAVHGWTLADDTLYAPQGGFELPADGANTIRGIIKFGGYVYTPSWSGTTTGDVWWGGDPLDGSSSNINPQFVAVPSGPYPATYAAYAAADFTPRCGGCQGSSLHSLSDILARIDSLP